ncbi:hypothetical protein BDC45DRAFT_532486 [Circinella umbellata]|nr:hypothetical protein BDC45DRAFT_532486 [Circinella umbellata]
MDDQLEGKRYSFPRFDDDDYLGDMVTTTRRSRPMENCIWLGDDQLEGKRYSFPRFDDTITLATWRQRHDDQDQWKTVSGWGTVNWRASDTVFLDSTIRLPWRHGDNDTTIKTNGKLYLAGGKDRALFVGRSTGGQAIQFSWIRRYDYLGDMATTTRRSRPMENCIWLGVRIGLFFVGRSTGGQAIQFSSIRRYDYLGDRATTTRRSRPMENCIWLGVRIGLFFVGRSTGGQAIQFSSIRRYDYLGDMATTMDGGFNRRKLKFTIIPHFDLLKKGLRRIV